MIWRDRMLTANTAVTGQAHSTAKQHVSWCPTKWCLSSSGSVCLWVFQSVSDYTCDCARGYDIVHLVCVIFFSTSVCVRVFVMHLMDREQTKSVRGAAGQLIRRVRCPRWVQQQQLLAHPASHIPKMADWQTIKTSLCHNEHLNLATDKQADVSSSAIRPVTVPFHTRFPWFTGHLLRER